MKNGFIFIGIAVIGLTSGYFFNQYFYPTPATEPTVEPTVDTPSASTQRPDFALKDVSGKLRNINEWDGKVLLVNFWASWCPPCVREIPDFVRLHETYQDKGFVIIGIALDEKQDVIDFIEPIGVEYPILVAPEKGVALTQLYGNRLGILPFSVIVDRKGKIISSHRGELDFEAAEQLIKPLL